MPERARIKVPRSLPRVDQGSSPRLIRRELIHRNPLESVAHVHADFGAFAKDYYIVDFGPRAGIVAVQDGKVLLTAQYRFLIDGVAWEIPGGRIEPGETAEQAAQRECLEETGCFCFDPKPLLSYRPGLDNVENLTTVLYSEAVEQRHVFEADPAEVLAVAWVPLEECVSLVFGGQIADALTISAVLAYHCIKGRA